MRGELERSGPGWLVTLLGASLLLFAGFAVGVVVGAAREEPELWIRHMAGQTDSVTPDAAPTDTAPPAPGPAGFEAPPAPAPVSPPPVDTAAPGPAAASPPASAAATGAPMPDVAAAPLPARSLEPAPLGEPPKPERKPAAAATGRYSVQVGAFADGKQAQGLAKNLGRRGLPVQVLPGGGAEGAKWRVRVGPVATREEADRIAAKLREEKLPTWILAEGR